MDLSLVNDISLTFALSVVVMIVCHKIRIPSIVGLLITGVLCGPSAFGLIEQTEAVNILSEIGIVFLMFTIGLELSGEEMLRLLRPVFVGGTAQVLMTTGLFTAVAMFGTGIGFGQGVLWGFLASLSSTAIVLSLLQQKGQSDSPTGRLTLGSLIFQDLAIVPMMLLIPLLAGRLEADLLSLTQSAVITALILGGGVFLAKSAVPRIMHTALHTRNRDIVLMTTLVLCMVVALCTEKLGLSLSLGAFLAGLLLSGSEYSLNAIEGILPFKTVFSSIFFISIGMLLDISFVLENWLMIFNVMILLIVLKILAAFPAMLLSGYPVRVCLGAAMCLAQIGEFSFVLAKVGMDNGLMNFKSYQIFLASSIFTMIITPAVIGSVQPITKCFTKLLWKLFRINTGEKDNLPEASKLTDHLLIIGFGIGGKQLARTAGKSGIPYVILEMNPDTVARFKEKEPIFYGDASRTLVLEHFGVQEARAMAIVISDPAAVRETVKNAKQLNPNLHIIARTRFFGEVESLKELGADDVISEEFETSVEIFTRVLDYYLIPRQKIDTFIATVRHETEMESTQTRFFHKSPIPSLQDSLPNVKLASYMLEDGAPLCGMSLAESELRKNYGITLIALRREGETFSSPAADMRMFGGDTLILLASPEALIRHADLWKKRKISF